MILTSPRTNSFTLGEWLQATAEHSSYRLCAETQAQISPKDQNGVTMKLELQYYVEING